jgi:hypothetical protein
MKIEMHRTRLIGGSVALYYINRSPLRGSQIKFKSLDYKQIATT